MLAAMTGAIAFDTHRFVKRLTDSGFTEKQAETLAEEHVALLNANLATKADIAAVQANIEALRLATGAGVAGFETGLRDEFAKFESGIGTALAEFKVDFLKSMLGAMIVQTAAIVALIKLL